MRMFADEGEPVVVIPVVVEPIEISVTLVVIPPRVRHSTIALERSVRETVQTTAYRIIRGLYLIQDNNPRVSRTEYLHFL